MVLFHQSINSVELEPSRLDAYFYYPDYTENHRLLRLSGLKISSLEDVAERISCGPFGSNLPSSLYRTSGVPLYRVQNVKDGEISEEGLVYLDYDISLSLKSCRFKSGDILIAKSGILGRVAFVPSNVESCNVTQDVIGVSIDQNKADAHYLVAFFSSKIGKTQIIRWGQGNIQQHLNMPSVRNFIWLNVDRAVQNYIGDKVRLAEKLRERSKQLELSTNQILDTIVPNYESSPKKTSRVNFEILENRLDTQPYRTNFLSLDRAICQVANSKLGKIASFSSGNPVPSKIFQSSGIPLVTIRDISKNGFINPEIFISYDYASNKKQYFAKPGTIVIGMDGEFRSQFFIEEELPQFINQRIAIINTQDIRPELLSFWLNRPEGQYQLNRWAVKTTVEHTSLDDIGKILIPRINTQLENQLADNILFSRRATWFGYKLTTAAKFLVEALIEGKLTETELKEAQTALQKEEIEPDKAILAKLTRQGYDIPNEPPLFPDLDALYEVTKEINLTSES